MSQTDPVAWPGADFVGRLQVACGALVDHRFDGAVGQEVVRALGSVPWNALSSIEFFVVRGILLSFLLKLANRPGAAEPSLGPILERLASSDATDLPAVATRALSRGIDGERLATSARDWRVDRVLTLVGTSFHHSVRVGDLAHDVGLSKWHLERLVKQVTNRSLRVHLAHARVAAASRLLGVRGVSVKEVSAHVGYGNPDSFRRDFKRRYGMTPQAWLRTRFD